MGVPLLLYSVGLVMGDSGRLRLHRSPLERPHPSAGQRHCPDYVVVYDFDAASSSRDFRICLARARRSAALARRAMAAVLF